jgi:hypothetical protein
MWGIANGRDELEKLEKRFRQGSAASRLRSVFKQTLPIISSPCSLSDHSSNRASYDGTDTSLNSLKETLLETSGHDVSTSSSRYDPRVSGGTRSAY